MCIRDSHQAYITALNGLVEKNPDLQGKSLEQIVAFSYNKPDLVPVFNNSGQHLNHSQFWLSMSPTGGGIPGKLETKLVEDFGSVQAFKDAFKTAGTTQFGSGWAWLVLAPDGKLKVTKSPNASTPAVTGEGKVLLLSLIHISCSPPPRPNLKTPPPPRHSTPTT